MESILEVTACPNVTRTGEINVAPTAKLRDPHHESELARFYKSGALSANMVRDRITFSILKHHEDGGIIVSAKGEVLDVERMEIQGEEFVYDTDSKIIYLDKDLPLRRLDDSFQENPSRTMNRFFKKADNPSKRCVDCRLLPLMFWIDASRKIMDVG